MPNLYGAFADGTTNVILMEWINGARLSEVTLTLKSMHSIMCKLADALIELHHMSGIIHNDIKPDNIIIENVGRGII